jgi:hypothetical protein
MNSKIKGNRGEWELLHRLEELGISAKRNDQRYIGGVDNADIDIYGVHIEVKRVEHLRLHEAMRQAIHDANGKAMAKFIIAADLGQAHDYTAITIIESKDGGECHLRHIERPPLGTSYPAIVEKLKALAESGELQGNVTVVIDRTGVGGAVWDLLAAAKIRGAAVKGIVITGGHEVKQDGDTYHVPKRDLVAAAVVALQNGRLRIARGLTHADLLVNELQNFQVKISVAGHDSYEAVREGTHCLRHISRFLYRVGDFVFTHGLPLAFTTWGASINFARSSSSSGRSSLARATPKCVIAGVFLIAS